MPSGGLIYPFDLRQGLGSSDLRLAFNLVGANLAGVLRYLYLAESTEASSGGAAVTTSTLDTPLRALVLNGLMVRPIVGTGDLLVDAGALLAVDPSYGATNDPYAVAAKFVVDPGISTAGQLHMANGDSSAVRFDCVEARLTSADLQTDVKKIWNEALGGFEPQNKVVVSAARLEYRIRQGTPGGGLSGLGLAAGWLPLAIARVPVNAASSDACDFWDVRPLLNDLAAGQRRVVDDLSRSPSQYALASQNNTGSVKQAYGRLDGTIAGRLAGGTLASQASPLDLTDATGVIEPGFSVTGQRPWYLYAAWFMGIPRWAKYTPASSGARLPGSFRGVPVYTQRSPLVTSGRPATALSPPSGLGFGVTTTDAVALMAGGYNATAGDWCGASVNAGWTHISDQNGFGIEVTGSVVGSRATFALTDGVTHPPHAVALRLRFRFTISGSAGNIIDCSLQFRSYTPLGSTIPYWQWSHRSSQSFTGAGSFLVALQVPELPLWHNATDVNQARSVTMDYSGAGGTLLANPVMDVVGWRLRE